MLQPLLACMQAEQAPIKHMVMEATQMQMMTMNPKQETQKIITKARADADDDDPEAQAGDPADHHEGQGDAEDDDDDDHESQAGHQEDHHEGQADADDDDNDPEAQAGDPEDHLEGQADADDDPEAQAGDPDADDDPEALPGDPEDHLEGKADDLEAQAGGPEDHLEGKAAASDDLGESGHDADSECDSNPDRSRGVPSSACTCLDERSVDGPELDDEFPPSQPREVEMAEPGPAAQLHQEKPKIKKKKKKKKKVVTQKKPSKKQNERATQLDDDEASGMHAFNPLFSSWLLLV